MRKPPQGRLSLSGGFDVCADKTCQNKPVPFWQVLAQQHAVVGELAARDLLELLQQVGYGAAISTALTIVIIVFSIGFTIVQKHVEKELV